MKNISINIALIIAFVFSSTIMLAQGDFISAKDFSKAAKDKNTVVISAQSLKNYKTSHVKNSVHINHKDLYKAGSIEGLIKSTADLSSYFGSKGVSDKNLIVIYDDGNNKYASRIFWILKYLGAPNVKLLQKDMSAWRASRIMITKVATKTKTATFTAKINKSIAVDYNFVKANVNKSNVVFIDSRHITEYNGTSAKPVSKGHIPGAVNIEWKSIETPKGNLKSNADLASLFKTAGVTKDKTIVIYCATSVRSGIIYVALKGLNYPNVKVYDGAYNEWIAKGGKLEK